MSKHRRSPVAPRALPLVGSAVLAAGLLPLTAGGALAVTADPSPAPPSTPATGSADIAGGRVSFGSSGAVDPVGGDHVGLALVGLGALGLAGAGTAGAVVFRPSQRRT